MGSQVHNRIPEYMTRVSIESMTTDNLDSNGIQIIPKHKSFMVSGEWLQDRGVNPLPIDEIILAKLTPVDDKKWFGYGVLK